MDGGRDMRPKRSGAKTPNTLDHAAGPLVRLADGRLARIQPESGQDRGSQRPAAVDICLVFDTTGSMSDKIDGLVHCMVDFVHEMAELGLDWQLTVVPFGDLTVPGDRVVEDLPFVTTGAAGERLIRTMPRFSGGGNEGESSLEAVLVALRKPYRARSVKVLVVLTDEPPLVDGQLDTNTVARALRKREVICFVVSPNLPGFKRWATENGGKWYLVGPSMDTRALLDFMQALVRDVAKTAKAVHEIGGGSVRRYLEIEPKRRGELPPGR